MVERGQTKEILRAVTGAAVAATALLFGLAATRGATPASAAAPSQPVLFADPAFRRVWERTDQFVAAGEVKRSFYWGPQPNGAGIQEDYAEGKGGKRLVQYFDKGRMEINDPSADPKNPFYVTPGRLTMEMVYGRIQTGNDRHIEYYPANIPIAGDTDDPTAPTYESMRSIQPGVDRFGQDRTGKLVMETATKDRGYGSGDFSGQNVRYAYFEPVTRHNIPSVFWTFLNARGPVLADGKQVDAPLSNPYFYVTGYPVTEPYWVYVKISGKPSTVALIQLFERRVLTYVPTATEGFRVQVSNAGRHYYDWRYKGTGKPRPISTCREIDFQAPVFKQVWLSDTLIQNRLYCPRQAVTGASSAFQPFEHGVMVYVSEPAFKDALAFKRIYVLYEGGEAEYFADTYDATAPQPTPAAAPPGLYTPVLGFGKVWREQAIVRQRLGYATAPEKGQAQGEFQFFAAGWMVKGSGQVYAYFDLIKRWESYAE